MALGLKALVGKLTRKGVKNSPALEAAIAAGKPIASLTRKGVRNSPAMAALAAKCRAQGK